MSEQAPDKQKEQREQLLRLLAKLSAEQRSIEDIYLERNLLAQLAELLVDVSAEEFKQIQRQLAEQDVQFLRKPAEEQERFLRQLVEEHKQFLRQLAELGVVPAELPTDMSAEERVRVLDRLAERDKQFLRQRVKGRERSHRELSEPAYTSPISLYFDLDHFAPTDIVDILGLFSDLYVDIGGDGLVIDDITLLDFHAAIVPVEE